MNINQLKNKVVSLISKQVVKKDDAMEIYNITKKHKTEIDHFYDYFIKHYITMLEHLEELGVKHIVDFDVVEEKVSMLNIAPESIKKARFWQGDVVNMVSNTNKLKIINDFLETMPEFIPQYCDATFPKGEDYLKSINWAEEFDICFTTLRYNFTMFIEERKECLQ
jgi:hypothetical protein